MLHVNIAAPAIDKATVKSLSPLNRSKSFIFFPCIFVRAELGVGYFFAVCKFQ